MSEPTVATLPVVFATEREQHSDSSAASATKRGGHDPYAKSTRLGAFSEDQVLNLPTDKLSASLKNIRAGLEEVFSSIGSVGDFELEEIKLTLEVTAKGGFALIGTAEAGAKGGITLTFKPPKNASS